MRGPARLDPSPSSGASACLACPPRSRNLSASSPGVPLAAPLTRCAVHRRARAPPRSDGQWYNAKVVALASDGYFVTYLGYGNTAQVRAA